MDHTRGPHDVVAKRGHYQQPPWQTRASRDRAAAAAVSGDCRTALSARLKLSTMICRGMPAGVRSSSEPPDDSRTAAEAWLGAGAVPILGGAPVVFALAGAGDGEGSGATGVAGAGADAVLFALAAGSLSRQNWRQPSGTVLQSGHGSAKNVVQQADARVRGVQDVSMWVAMALQEATSAQRADAPVTSQTLLRGARAQGSAE